MRVCIFQQSQAVDPEQFSSQESNIILEQKAPVFTQQYASQAQMAQGNYTPMQDPNFHPMAQRPGYAALRMQPRPGLRPAGIVQNPPNQLRLQLQHRLQAQQVFHTSLRHCLAIIQPYVNTVGINGSPDTWFFIGNEVLARLFS